MDGKQFDTLARFVGAPTTRRWAARSLGGGAFSAMLGLLGLAEADAHNPLKKCKKLKGKKKKACVKKAKKHNATHADDSPVQPPQAELCPEAAFQQCKAPAWEQALKQAEVCRPDCESDPEGEACQICVRPFAADVGEASRTCAAEVCRGGLAQADGTEQEGQASTSARLQAAAVGCNETELERCIEDLVVEDIICNGVAIAACIETLGIGCAVAVVGCDANWRYKYGKCIERNGCPDGGYCIDNVCCPRRDDTVCNGQCCHRDSECCNGKCHPKAAEPTPCGSTCCYAQFGQTCCGSICCYTQYGQTCCGSSECCASGSVCCNGTCCPHGQICDSGTCKCPSEKEACGDECCYSYEFCEDGTCVPDCYRTNDCGG